MRDFIDTSLFYNFLLRELWDGEEEFWGVVANIFGVEQKDKEFYGKLLKNPENLSATTDYARKILNAKTKALKKTGELFGEARRYTTKISRLSPPSETDSVARVLYLLDMIYFNSERENAAIARGTLKIAEKNGLTDDEARLLSVIEKTYNLSDEDDGLMDDDEYEELLFALFPEWSKEMRLADEPFEKIKSGEKTVEVRLYDDKRKQIKVGDKITFYRLLNKQDTITVTVTALHRFKTFKELFSSALFPKTGSGNMSVAEATDRMYQYYTKEVEQQYGVLGIEFVIQ